MYIPKHFSEPRIEVLQDLIRANPLATVVTLSADGLNANHIPLHLSGSPAPYGKLQGHVARANPLLDDLAGDTEALVIFHGPHAYISPSWYATKKDTGKVVPTWNFSVVHAYGTLKVVDDAAWLRSQLEQLTAHNEASFAEPWQVSDAPQEFIDKISGAIVGVEMVITKLLGKSKASQNQPSQNQASVVAGLKALGTDAGLTMAELIEKHGER